MDPEAATATQTNISRAGNIALGVRCSNGLVIDVEAITTVALVAVLHSCDGEAVGLAECGAVGWGVVAELGDHVVQDDAIAIVDSA